jgi:hypothetical protein
MHFGRLNLDPDPHWEYGSEYGSESGSRRAKMNHKTDDVLFRGMKTSPVALAVNLFQVVIKTLDLDSDPDLDPH